MARLSYARALNRFGHIGRDLMRWGRDGRIEGGTGFITWPVPNRAGCRGDLRCHLDFPACCITRSITAVERRNEDPHSLVRISTAIGIFSNVASVSSLLWPASDSSRLAGWVSARVRSKW